MPVNTAQSAAFQFGTLELSALLVAQPSQLRVPVALVTGFMPFDIHVITNPRKEAKEPMETKAKTMGEPPSQHSVEFQGSIVHRIIYLPSQTLDNQLQSCRIVPNRRGGGKPADSTLRLSFQPVFPLSR
jgi:hypothetical protein